MAYPKYIKDTEDGCVLKLNETKTEWENELEGCSISIEGYEDYKECYIASNKEEFEEYNKKLEEGFSREARLTNKEWKQVIQVLSEDEDESSKGIVENIKDWLGY